MSRALAAGLCVALAPCALAVDAPALFKARCAPCHGEDGKADTKVGKQERIPDLTAESFQASVTDEEIRSAIEDGVKDTKMKGFKGRLTGEEIDALVAHVRSFRRK